MLCTIWWVTHALGGAKPLIALGLLAVNATVIQWGDSLRAYGLGAVLMLLTTGLVWKMVEQPTVARFSSASVLALLSVQCLYQNAFILAAACLSAVCVCLRHKRFKTALMCVGTALPAALSLLPYIRPLQQSQSWWIVEKGGFIPSLAWSSFSEAVGTPPLLGPLIWLGLFVFATWTGMATLERHVTRRDDISIELPLFGALTVFTGAFGFFLFLWNAGLPSQPWYWLPLMPVVAVCIQTALSNQVARHRLEWTLAVGLVVLISLLTAWGRVTERQTNIDLVARVLNEQVDEADLVVIAPWYYGISFNRYYNGQAKWITIPPIADHRFHRYDLLKEKLAASDPIGPALEQIRQTLRAGRKVWVVGTLPKPQPGETTVPTLPPAPHGKWGWYDSPYNYVWGRQTRHSIETTATQIEEIVAAGISKQISRFENVGLFVASGYRPGAFPTASAAGVPVQIPRW